MAFYPNSDIAIRNIEQDEKERAELKEKRNQFLANYTISLTGERCYHLHLLEFKLPTEEEIIESNKFYERVTGRPYNPTPFAKKS